MGWGVLVSVVGRYIGVGYPGKCCGTLHGVGCPGKRCGALHWGRVSW